MSGWALVFIYTTYVVSKSSGLTVQRERGSEPQITQIALMGCEGVLVVGCVAVVDGVVVWLACPSLPGHTPLAALRLLAPLSLCERGAGCRLMGSVRFLGLRVLRRFGFRIAGIKVGTTKEGDGSLKPIELEPRSIHIQADRRLVYQVLTAYGGSGQSGLDGYSTRVIEDHGHRKLVEFHTPLRIRNSVHVARTVEWVQLTEPGRIDFWLAAGYEERSIFALSLLEDAFVLDAKGGCTEMRYESRLAVKAPVVGWLLARLVIGPVMSRHMVEHLEEIRAMCETRAVRSRVWPQGECGHGGER